MSARNPSSSAPDDVELSDPLLAERWEAAVADGTVAGVTLAALLRHLPARRATLFAHRHGEPVVVKVFGSPRARGNQRRLAALDSAGLRDLVPRGLAHSTDGHVGLLTFTPGECLEEVEDDAFVGGVGAAGAALARLHASGAALDRAWTHDDEVRQLIRRAPDSCRGAADDAARLRVGDVPLVPAHRDFHPRQVVLRAGAPDDVALIDLDDAAFAPPGLDVGNMLAHLTREAVLGRRAGEVVDAARSRFLAGYGDPPDDLAAWETLSLARLAGLAESRHGRPDERDALLALATDRMRGLTHVDQVPTGHDDRPVRIEQEPDGRRTVVKTYRGADGAAVHEAMRELWASPFGAHRRGGAGLPRPLGFDARSGELRMEVVDGSALGERGDLGRSRERAADVAALLAGLHESGVEVARRRSRAGLLRSASRKAAELSSTATGPAYDHALEHLRAAAGDLPEDEPLVLSHGDFSPRNVLEAADRLVLIDFDRIQMAAPWRDVGYWRAWLWATLDLGDAGWAAGDPVTEAYAARSGRRVDATTLRWHEAMALLRIAHGWSTLRADPGRATEVVREAAHRVDG